MKTRLLLIALLLALALACGLAAGIVTTGCNWPNPTPDAYSATATYGAEQYHLQLTAEAQP